MPEMKSRDDYIDFLKGMTILFVVMGHMITKFSDASSVDILFNFIYSFHMPLFFFISGYTEEKYCIKYEDHKSLMLKRRSYSLIIPYFLWKIIYFFSAIKAPFSHLPLLLSSLLGYRQDSLWFIAVMWGLKLLHYVLWVIREKILSPICHDNRCAADIIIFFSLECLLIVCAFTCKHPYIINMISYAIPYFSAILLIDSAKLQSLAANPFVSVLVVICYMIVFPHFSFYDPAWTTQLLRIILSMCIIFLLYPAGTGPFPSVLSHAYAHICKFLLPLGQATMEIYMLHGFFLDHVKSSPPFDSTLLQTIYILLISGLVCFLCTVIAKAVDHIPYVSMILFGKIKN